MADEQNVRSEEEIWARTVGEPKVLTAPIVISEYDPRWPELFGEHARRIRAALGERALLLEHAGSTSVPGLAAKPQIDIVLAVLSSADEATYVPDLERIGYGLMIREPEWFEHRVLNRTDIKLNLHVFSLGCPEIDQMLLFRDWLRTHPEERALYANAKRELAQRPWKYMQQYADAKTSVVHEILARARSRGRQTST